MKKMLIRGFKIIAISLVSMVVLALAFVAYKQWSISQISEELEEVADGDTLFWLMQKETNRYSVCDVYYSFDSALNDTIVLQRLKELVSEYKMFHRNVVEVDGLPYWQKVNPDWSQNFRILDAKEDLEEARIKADYDISQPYELGEGLPLFRAILSADRRQLVFVWNHVVSDFEGMFNKHAKHLFAIEKERTQYGYQVNTAAKKNRNETNLQKNPSSIFSISERKRGFSKSDFEVEKLVLPIKDKVLKELGEKANLPMSDIFSFISVRALTHYHLNDKDRENIPPIMTPLSLRKSSLERDEGNNRAIKTFPFVFPLEEVEEMYQRVANLPSTSNSYESAGRTWKTMRQMTPFLESIILRKTGADYISNYFPLADDSVSIDVAKLTGHHLRVTMAPYERAKFAWSSYDGEVQLYLHTDPKLVDKEQMIKAYGKALNEVLQFLKSYPLADTI